MIEGVDYSAGRPGSAALRAAGKRFAVRYLADDWRGIFPDEYRELTGNGVDVAAVFETWGDRRQFSGEAQGIVDAVFAQNKLLRTGMPAAMPVYFATDWDAQPAEMPDIDAYLRGAAKVLGAARVGVYGGFSVLDHCHAAGSARWFWQTSAWEYGRGLHPAAHLYQHTYNYWIAGTNCDLTDAHQDNYGQASRFDGTRQPDLVEPVPTFPAPAFPDWYERANKRDNPSAADWKGNRWYPQRALATAIKVTYSYVEPSIKSAHSGPAVAEGKKIPVDWVFEDGDGKMWLVNDRGYHVAARFSPEFHLPEPRKVKAA